MAAIKIDDELIPDLTGKVALITGGSSGIGFAAAELLLARNAAVHVLDVKEPGSGTEPWEACKAFQFHRCNVASFSEQRSVFDKIGRVDMVFANAGVSEPPDCFSMNGSPLAEDEGPNYTEVLDVNLMGVLHTVLLARRSMRAHGVQSGSVVITISAVAYAPEQSLPVYAASKAALVGLVRSLRSTMLSQEGITINAVAPAATITNLLPLHLAAPIIAGGLPTSESRMVGRALVFSATAKQDRRVEAYGKERDGDVWPCVGGGAKERWNGRIILTLGDTYTEMEGPIADLRPYWFGAENLRLTRAQQAATDFRENV